jgi:tRNA-Thr(GGU) m(6)t(6)A37 methyltransferase TsaA
MRTVGAVLAAAAARCYAPGRRRLGRGAMTDDRAARPGERRLAGGAPPADDAGLVYIGRIRTPFTERGQCPKNVRESEAICRLELDPRWTPALDGLATASHVVVLYWLDRARRDFLVQAPGHAPRPLGTFALRSPNRPNPIGFAAVPLVAIEDDVVTVRGLDCLDGTPLLDLKPYIARTDAHADATLGWRDAG